MRDQLNAGATSQDSTNTKDDTHQAHTHSFQQDEYEMMTFVLQMRKNPEKTLTQGTCPVQGSNPGPLRDRRACYRLFNSGGHI